MAEKRIEIEDLLKYRFPENLQYSPDGTFLAFQLAQADEKNNSYTRDVWIVADGKPKQLTANMNASIVCWDDETHLILTRDNKNDEPGDTQLYKIDVTGGEAQKWLKLPPAVRELKKVSDDTYVFTAMIRADDPDAYLDSDKVKAEKAEQKKKDADYQVIDEIPYWFNGAGYINGTRTALFTLQTGEKNVIRRITSRSSASVNSRSIKTGSGIPAIPKEGLSVCMTRYSPMTSRQRRRSQNIRRMITAFTV